jgi:mRNA-degrading endonuclease RelE of RelBE toxin-antitoxin system
MTTRLPIRVEPSLLFQKAYKRLRKKYRQLDDDILPLIEQLQSGETPGDQIQGVRYTIFKVRIQNTDAQRGKSGGYRVIYYVQTVDNIILAYIYAKSEREDISMDELRRMIREIGSD